MVRWRKVGENRKPGRNEVDTASIKSDKSPEVKIPKKVLKGFSLTVLNRIMTFLLALALFQTITLQSCERKDKEKSSQPIKISSLIIYPSELSMYVGEVFPLSITALDEKGESVKPPDVEWSSSNTSVLIVNNYGVVKAIAPGEATITAIATDELFAEAKIRVFEVGEMPGYDYDGDGYISEKDCDDRDTTINPLAQEVCDGKDNDCDGEIDEDVSSKFYADKDGDGYGDPSTYVLSCTQPAGYVLVSDDCDDSNPNINPSASEVCDGVDNDCDGKIDEGVKKVFYKDSDGDNYTDGTTLYACAPAVGYVELALSGDCNDLDSTINPSAKEVCDGKDNDCDGQIDEEAVCTFAREPDSAPQGVSAIPLSTSSIRITWIDASTNELGFKVERGISPDNLTTIANLGAGMTEFTDSGLSPNTTYYYRVVAYTPGGDRYSDIVSATTLRPSPPSSPSGLIAVAVGATQVNLSWTDNSQDEVGFFVLRSTDATNWQVVATDIAPDTTVYEDMSAQPDTTYFYQVFAFNPWGSSGSNIDTASTPPASPPNPPSSLTVSASGENSIILMWQDNSSNEDGFIVERSVNGTNWIRVSILPPNSIFFFDSGLLSETTYYYRVYAFNVVGNSSYSNTASATTPPPSSPNAPYLYTVEAISPTSVYLRWFDNSYNESGFYIERSTDGTNWTRIGSTVADITSFLDSGLSPSSTYYYRVGAYNDSGIFYSNEVSTTTQKSQCEGFPVEIPSSSSILTADLDKDGKKEIITGSEYSGTCNIYVLSSTGEVKGIFSLPSCWISPQFIIADTDKNGTPEVIGMFGNGIYSFELTPGCQGTAFEDDFEVDFSKWSPDPYWVRTSEDSASGTYSAKGTSDSGEKYLISDVINLCSSSINIKFKAKWDTNYSCGGVRLLVWDSVNSQWNEVWSRWCDSQFAWQDISVSVPPSYLSGTTTKIAFVINSWNTNDYFFVDDVRVSYGPKVVWSNSINSSKTIADDINQDGDIEIVGVSDYYLYLLSSTGNIVWWQSFSSGINNLYLADIDGDGAKEIVGKAGDTIFAYESDGNPTSGYPISVPNASDLATYDVDKDGIAEIFVATGDGYIEAYKSASSWWSTFTGDWNGGIMFTDLEGGGIDMLVRSSGNLYAFRTTDGATKQGWPYCCVDEYSSADINSDGLVEVVVRSGSDIYSIDPAGNTLWSGYVGYSGWSASFPFISDVDGDGIFDVISSGRKCVESICYPALYAFSSAGEVLPGYPLTTTLGDIITDIIIDDIDGDGKLEVIAVSTMDMYYYPFYLNCWELEGSVSMWGMRREGLNTTEWRRSYDPYEQNDSMGLAYYVAGVSSQITAYLTDGDEDWYKVYVPAGERLSLALTNLPHDYNLELYDSSGNPLASSTNTGTQDEFIGYTPGVSGWYFIRVVSAGNYSFSYPYVLFIQKY